MSKIFSLPPRKDGKDHQGEQIINNRYRFVDGRLEVSDDTAKKIEPILCRFYSCTVEDVPVVAKEEKIDEASLKASQTKK